MIEDNDDDFKIKCNFSESNRVVVSGDMLLGRGISESKQEEVEKQIACAVREVLYDYAINDHVIAEPFVYPMGDIHISQFSRDKNYRPPVEMTWSEEPNFFDNIRGSLLGDIMHGVRKRNRKVDPELLLGWYQDAPSAFILVFDVLLTKLLVTTNNSVGSMMTKVINEEMSMDSFNETIVNPVRDLMTMPQDVIDPSLRIELREFQSFVQEIVLSYEVE